MLILLPDGYELGGLATSVKRDPLESGISFRGKSYKEPHCLYPGDLYPFTRRPMFIIIDSDNSFVSNIFQDILGSHSLFLCRLRMYHQHFKVTDVQHHGSLFTLFLHSPLTALCYICNVGDVPIHHWERCQCYVDRFVTEASRLVTRCRIDEIEQGIGFIVNVVKITLQQEFRKVYSLLATFEADSYTGGEWEDE
uniref:Uncharacterized protein n=1 Tax=Megaselia scalaris TaxID=36166 RepID=T1GHQ1_MEGSC